MGAGASRAAVAPAPHAPSPSSSSNPSGPGFGHPPRQSPALAPWHSELGTQPRSQVPVSEPSAWCGLIFRAGGANPDGGRKQLHTLFDRQRDPSRLVAVSELNYALP